MIRKKSLLERIARLERTVLELEDKNREFEYSICNHEFKFVKRVELVADWWNRHYFKDLIERAKKNGIFKCKKCGKIIEREITEEEKKAIYVLNGVEDEQSSPESEKQTEDNSKSSKRAGKKTGKKRTTS